jgi:hypothetical protein
MTAAFLPGAGERDDTIRHGHARECGRIELGGGETVAGA